MTLGLLSRGFIATRTEKTRERAIPKEDFAEPCRLGMVLLAKVHGPMPALSAREVFSRGDWWPLSQESTATDPGEITL